MPCRLFAFGMALAVLRVDSEDGLRRWPRAFRSVAVPLGVIAYLVTARMTGVSEQLSYSFYNTLMAIAFACLLAVVVLPGRRHTKPSMLGSWRRFLMAVEHQRQLPSA